jgi:protein ImuA
VDFSPDLSSLIGPSPPTAAADLVALHPALWRAAQLGRAGAAVVASGFAALDAVLPGGGWPAGVLTELLLPHPGVGEWRLLAPVLATLQRGGGPDGVARPVMLFGPPGQPCAWALGALGLDLRQLVLVCPSDGPGQAAARCPAGADRAPMQRPGWRAGAGRVPAADVLWSLEQALASGQVGAALAWLPPRLPADALRRLQLAAQAHPGPVFLFREAEARARPSAAPLRLQLAPASADMLCVHVVKRRGPPLAGPLRLALPPVLSAPARERALARPGRTVPGAPAARRDADADAVAAGWRVDPASGAGRTTGGPRRPGTPDQPAPTVAA